METLVNNVTLINSLEYNAYFARGWYATFTNITSRQCMGNGLAFGMPLVVYGRAGINWTTSAPRELNNVKIDNIRSHSAGCYFSVENPGSFNPKIQYEDERLDGEV